MHCKDLSDTPTFKSICLLQPNVCTEVKKRGNSFHRLSQEQDVSDRIENQTRMYMIWRRRLIQTKNLASQQLINKIYNYTNLVISIITFLYEQNFLAFYVSLKYAKDLTARIKNTFIYMMKFKYVLFRMKIFSEYILTSQWIQ